MIYRILIIFIVCMLSTSIGFAEVIYLKDGKVVRGKVIDKTPYSVKIEVQGVARTYYVNEIKRIEGLKEEFSGFESTEKPKTTEQEASPEERSPREVAEAKRELVGRLLEANGVREAMSARYMQIIAKYPPDVQETLRDLFVVDELVGRIVPIYAKYYTEDEIKELIVFYKSAVGNKSLGLTEQITEETVNMMIEYFLEKAKQQGYVEE